MRVLDLFCGAGGAAVGLKRAWPHATIVGVDIVAQPRYPFTFIKADAMLHSCKGYDFVWASPPCQAYTRAQRIRSNIHPDLIGELRSKLDRLGTAYVIENVSGAPLINPIEFCGASFPPLQVYRHRLFEASFSITAPKHECHAAPLRKMGRPVRDGEFMHVVGNFSGVDKAREAMGIPWMTRDELREAIPPAFSEFIAKQFEATR